MKTTISIPKKMLPVSVWAAGLVGLLMYVVNTMMGVGGVGGITQAAVVAGLVFVVDQFFPRSGQEPAFVSSLGV